MVTGTVTEVMFEAILSRNFIVLKNVIFCGLRHFIGNRVSSFTFVAWYMFETDLNLVQSAMKVSYVKFFTKIDNCLD